MQKIKYSFDHAGNITNIFNDETPFGAFIGGYNNKYKYDGLHRLIWSDGDNMLGQYDMEMQYSPSGRIAHKQYTLPARALSHPVDMHYSYCDDYQPHAVRHIFDEENMTHCDLRLGQYTFNGKEKDYESGFHYYGARYYWSEVLTGWLSVDPMMDMYPGISPYQYCRWNPIKRIDVDGLFDTEKKRRRLTKKQ